MKTLAGFSNVWCKLSGVNTEADWERWTAEGVRPYLGHTLDAFGIERLMFGGDWPVVNLTGSFRAWWDALLWAVDSLSDTEKQNCSVKTPANFIE